MQTNESGDKRPMTQAEWETLMKTNRSVSTTLLFQDQADGGSLLHFCLPGILFGKAQSQAVFPPLNGRFLKYL
jgi:hypothetical protein